MVQVATTTSSRENADQIARKLVEEKLAACVQISGPITSFYHWQGTLQEDREYLLTIKTAKKHIPAISEIFSQLHPYDLPELIALPIVDGSPAYLAWIKENLKLLNG